MTASGSETSVSLSGPKFGTEAVNVRLTDIRPLELERFGVEEVEILFLLLVRKGSLENTPNLLYYIYFMKSDHGSCVIRKLFIINYNNDYDIINKKGNEVYVLFCMYNW